jgi:hypothetical protein
VNRVVHERVYAFPETVDLGALHLRDVGNAALAQTVMIYQSGGHEFNAEARSDVPGLDVRSQPSARGDRVQLTVSITPAAARAGEIAGTIRVTTNDPAFPELRVPVTGRILAD